MDVKLMAEPGALNAAMALVASPHNDATAEVTYEPGAPVLSIERLDTLAHVVADALDCDDDRRAWTITQALERIAGLADDSPRPVRPVIGRRFARAHGRLLEPARRDFSPGQTTLKPPREPLAEPKPPRRQIHTASPLQRQGAADEHRGHTRPCSSGRD